MPEKCSQHDGFVRELDDAKRTAESAENISKQIVDSIGKLSGEFQRFRGELNGTLPTMKRTLEILNIEIKEVQETRRAISVHEEKISEIKSEVREKLDKEKHEVAIKALSEMIQGVSDKHGFWIKIFGGFTALGTFIGSITAAIMAVSNLVK